MTATNASSRHEPPNLALQRRGGTPVEKKRWIDFSDQKRACMPGSPVEDSGRATLPQGRVTAVALLATPVR